MGFFAKVREFFRDKTRDLLCANLQSMGIKAQMAEWVRTEENIECGVYSVSLGMIDILEGPIRWVNVIKRTTGQTSDYYIKYGVPDSRLRSNSQKIEIKSTVKRGDLQWKGKDAGFGIIDRLNSDLLLKNPIKYAKVQVKIHAYATPGCWIISTDPFKYPSEELWSCHQSVAQHLLAEWTH